MSALILTALSFGWEVLKIFLAVKAAWFAYVWYGLHKGFIHFSS